MHLNFSKGTRLTSLSGALPPFSRCQTHSLTHSHPRLLVETSIPRRSGEAPGSGARPPRGSGTPRAGEGGDGTPGYHFSFPQQFHSRCLPGRLDGARRRRRGPGRAEPCGPSAPRRGRREGGRPPQAPPRPGPSPAEGLPVYPGQPQPRSCGGFCRPCPQPRRDRQRGCSSPGDPPEAGRSPTTTPTSL